MSRACSCCPNRTSPVTRFPSWASSPSTCTAAASGRRWSWDAQLDGALRRHTRRRPRAGSRLTRRDRISPRFWSDVGESFPDLGGAASTDVLPRERRAAAPEHLGRSAACAFSRPISGTKRRTRASCCGPRARAPRSTASTSRNRSRDWRAHAAPDARARVTVADCRHVPYGTDRSTRSIRWERSSTSTSRTPPSAKCGAC